MRSTARGADGAFAIEMKDGFHADGRSLEVRVRAPGCRTWRGPRDRAFAVRLEKMDVPPRPGAIRGTAMGADRRPLSGVRTFDLVDEFTVRVSVCAVADEYGQFALEGIWPGVWRVSLDGDDRRSSFPTAARRPSN